LQVKPQVPFVQVATPLDEGHGTQDVPQFCGLSLETQSPQQLW
jgi:hypothetical protein